MKIESGHELPSFYGIAWQCPYANAAICYPIPFNLIIFALRSLWIFMRWGYRRVPINPRVAYLQGYREGYKKGLKEGGCVMKATELTKEELDRALEQLDEMAKLITKPASLTESQ